MNIQRVACSLQQQREELLCFTERGRVSRRRLSPVFYQQSTLRQGDFSKDFPARLTLSPCQAWLGAPVRHLATAVVLCNPDQNKHNWSSHLKLATRGWAGAAILQEAFSCARLQNQLRDCSATQRLPRAAILRWPLCVPQARIPAPAPPLWWGLQEMVCNTGPQVVCCFCCLLQHLCALRRIGEEAEMSFLAFCAFFWRELFLQSPPLQFPHAPVLWAVSL